MFVVLSICFSTFTSAGVVSSSVEILEFNYNPTLNQIDAAARACPPFFWGKWVSGSKMQKMIRKEFTKKVITFQRNNKGSSVKLVSFSTQLETNFFRSSTEGNRCTGGTAIYSVQMPDSTPNLTKKAISDKTSVLKVGVRDGYPMISEYQDGEWAGAAILFAEMVGRELGKEVKFVKLKGSKQRITSVKHGMVDMVISLISYTSERAKTVLLSASYFNTGLVMATKDTAILDTVSRWSDLNNSSYTIHFGKGTTAETYAKKHFPGARLVAEKSTVTAYKKLESAFKKGNHKNHLVITDEVIASAWDVLTVEVKGNQLLTDNDKYVVAAKDKAIITAINKVIQDNGVTQIYSDLTGR